MLSCASLRMNCFYTAMRYQARRIACRYIRRFRGAVVLTKSQQRLRGFVSYHSRRPNHEHSRSFETTSATEEGCAAELEARLPEKEGRTMSTPERYAPALKIQFRQDGDFVRARINMLDGAQAGHEFASFSVRVVRERPD